MLFRNLIILSLGPRARADNAQDLSCFNRAEVCGGGGRGAFFFPEEKRLRKTLTQIKKYSKITKRRETRARAHGKQENQRKKVWLYAQLWRKNNGSFNYRIDCLKFLSTGYLRPFVRSFFLSAHPLFFFIISVSVCQFSETKQRTIRCSCELRVFFVLYELVRSHRIRVPASQNGTVFRLCSSRFGASFNLQGSRIFQMRCAILFYFLYYLITRSNSFHCAVLFSFASPLQRRRESSP